jgi:hypothetical protein
MSGQIANLCGGGQYTYSVSPVSGATSYVWTVPAGCTIVTNNGNSIVLNIPSSFTTGTLSVRAFNSCGGSSLRSVSLTRLPATPASITGASSVCPNQTDVNFSTQSVSGVTQLWTVPSGATITAGQGTTTMTCTWGTTAGNVTLRSVNACGQSAALTRSVSIASCFEEENQLPMEGRLSDVMIYPNPNLGEFTIKSSHAGEFMLINSLGQVIEMFTLGGNAPQTKDVSGLSSGVYYIRSVKDGVMERVVVAND